jgi:hypothetical protein
MPPSSSDDISAPGCTHGLSLLPIGLIGGTYRCIKFNTIATGRKGVWQNVAVSFRYRDTRMANSAILSLSDVTTTVNQVYILNRISYLQTGTTLAVTRGKEGENMKTKLTPRCKGLFRQEASRAVQYRHFETEVGSTFTTAGSSRRKGDCNGQTPPLQNGSIH